MFKTNALVKFGDRCGYTLVYNNVTTKGLYEVLWLPAKATDTPINLLPVGEGKQKFSKSLYTIDKREGYKLIIKDEKRKLKPSELLKADKASNPISQAYIDRTIK